MNARKAIEADIDSIEQIYNRIHDGEEMGLSTIGWVRGVYPTRTTAMDALERDDLFVLEDDGKVVAAAVINQIPVQEYKDANWQHPVEDSKVLVLHVLVVDPLEQGKGYGKAFVKFYEDYAKEHRCLALHMDTQERNAFARKMYNKLGYDEVGVVTCVFNGMPNIHLVCLEKYLG